MDTCTKHSKKLVYVCKNTSCPTSFFCDHGDCLKEHEHDGVLNIFVISKIKEASSSDSSADNQVVLETKGQLTDYFQFLRIQLMDKLEEFKSQSLLEVQKIAMQLSYIDPDVKIAREQLLGGELSKIDKDSVLKLASSMKNKLDFQARSQLYLELKNEARARLQKAKMMVTNLSKSAPFISLFQFKSTYRGPKEKRVFKRCTGLNQGWSHNAEKADAIVIKTKKEVLLKGFFLHEITDWNNSQLILLSMTFKDKDKVFFTEEIILSKDINSDMDIEIIFPSAVKLKPQEKYELVLLNMGEMFKSKHGTGKANDEYLLVEKSSEDSNGTNPEKGEFHSFIYQTV